MQDVSAAVAAWAGWSIAAAVARLSGFGQVGAPPDHHYRFHRGAGRGRGSDQVGVYDLLQIGNRTDLGDGLTPQQRAEHCLRMFLGPLYATLHHQGFLDVSSKLSHGLVYRLRLDPQRRVDRRVRVFEHGRYVRDLCIVRLDRQIPVQDAWLTIFLGLLSDEREVLRVVGRHNIFAPYSDSQERETVPASWTARTPAPAPA